MSIEKEKVLTPGENVVVGSNVPETDLYPEVVESIDNIVEKSFAKGELKDDIKKESDLLTSTEETPSEELVDRVVNTVFEDSEQLLQNKDIFPEGVDKEEVSKNSPVLEILKKHDAFKECENFWDVAKKLSSLGKEAQTEWLAIQAFIGGNILIFAGTVNPVARFLLGAPLLRWGVNNSSILRRFLTEEDVNRIANGIPRNRRER